MALSTNVASWTQAQYQTATAADIAGLSTAQAAALTHPEWLLPAAAAGFSAAQVAALTAGWGAVSAAWLNALSPAAFAAIPTKNIALFAKAALDGLSAKQIAGMSTAQVAAIAHADWLGITAYAGFSAAQVAAITTSWSYMSAAQINALSTTAIAGLSATAIGNISASAFAGIDAAHLKALSATQAAAITSAQTGALTAAQIAALSTGQIAAMTNLAGLTATAAAALSAAQVAAITNGWGSFSAAQIAALSPAALAAASAANLAKLTTSATAGITAAQATALTPAQIAALGHADWLSTAAFGALSAAQVAAISTNWYWMSAASLNAIKVTSMSGIPLAGIAALTTTAITGLNAAHLAALTAAQIAGLTGSQIKVLSASQLSALTAAQVAALTTAQITLLTAAQMAGLSAAQAAALTASQLSGLTAAQVAGLTSIAAAGLSASQLAALGLAITGLTASTIAGIPAATLAKLSGQQLAVLTLGQTAALTTGQLTALAPAQIAYFTAGQLQALGTKIQALSAASLAAISVTNLVSVYSYLTSAQLASLPATLAAAVKQAISQSTALVASLTSAGLLAQVQSVIASGQSLYSYRGLLGVLTGLGNTIATTGLNAAQLADLKLLTKAVGSIDGTGSYLYGVLNALVNGNAANATWTGGKTSSVALGNLAVGSSALQFQELVGKWFLGTDLPSWSSATTYSVKSAPLFTPAGVSSSDPRQGGIGDCYLIAAMVEVALDEPKLIASMFTDNGNGTYGVRLFAPNGTPLYFTVDAELPAGYVAQATTGALWVSLLEKAFVAYKNEVNGTANAYASINGGWSNGLTAITGKTVTNYICAYTPSQAVWDTTVKNAVIAALNAGQEVCYGSFISNIDKANGKTDMVSGHEFAVTGYDKLTDKFILQNPWGAAGGSTWNGVFEQSIDDLWGGTSGSACASGFIVANGNSPAVNTASTFAASQLAYAMASDTGMALHGSLTNDNGPLSLVGQNASSLMPTLAMASHAA